jgi:hypothetical protein
MKTTLQKMKWKSQPCQRKRRRRRRSGRRSLEKVSAIIPGNQHLALQGNVKKYKYETTTTKLNLQHM